MSSTVEQTLSSLRPRLVRWAPASLTILLGAVLLWVITGVGFVNYDTLYGLVWGQQLTRGEAPEYGLPIAPTPHPLVELLGIPLAPLGASATTAIAVALAFLALSACGWVIYRLGSEWFGRGAGAVAALILLTRGEVLSYGVRAYVDVPYLLLVLWALLVETRKPRAGAPVLVLLGLAGLLRPEAWAFSGMYWVYLVVSSARSPVSGRTRRQLAELALLAASAPLVWVLSDLLVTGNAMWSLTNTKHTAEVLGRQTGIAKVPEYIPRRVGEILRPAVLAGAAVGGVLSLLWLRDRARLGALAGVLAVLVFAAMASVGLPIDTRYAFLIAAILCLFCGVGVFGWIALPKGDRRRTAWMAVGGVVALGLLATLPGQVRSAHHQLQKLAQQESIQDDLLAMVHNGAITPKCGPVGVPNHAPIPLLALYLKERPGLIVSAEAARAESKQQTDGTYADPASIEVEKEYVLDPKDPHLPVSIPPGFLERQSNRSWLLFEHCG
ncbi:MAG TPA: hypothetical protein VK781_13240 [Solirubrobacteraceae bacterium]|nr:hypothetical protein [Solirubrobacteraceae bacterium]